MITFLTADTNGIPLDRLLRTTDKTFPQMRKVTYSEVILRRRTPGSTVIFTDFDFLSDLELDAAGRMAAALAADGKEHRILNNPLKVMERAELLANLYRAGLNPVQVSRLGIGERPSKYPVFVRLASGCAVPDTDLLFSEAELDTALAKLEINGRTLRGRIAVSFEAKVDEKGNYRKYGAFRIGDTIIPQHILRSKNWVVKSDHADHDPSFAAEELAFVTDNPHATELMKIFNFAHVEFGRIDYTLRDGEIVVFEINTNPTFPRFNAPQNARSARREIIKTQMASAFHAIDIPSRQAGPSYALHEKIDMHTKRSAWTWSERKMFRAFRRWDRLRGKRST